MIVANPRMINAYKAGVPGNGQPFPEGSMIVKLQWKLKSLLLTLPIALWSFLMFANPQQHPNRSLRIAGLITAAFMIVLFFMMMRTWSTYRWRRWFFVALGLLFPVGFIHNVMLMRGTMGLPIEEMIAGRTPFCYLPIPLLILPVVFTKTLVFPGSLCPAEACQAQEWQRWRASGWPSRSWSAKAGAAMPASSEELKKAWPRCPRAPS